MYYREVLEIEQQGRSHIYELDKKLLSVTGRQNQPLHHLWTGKLFYKEQGRRFLGREEEVQSRLRSQRTAERKGEESHATRLLQMHTSSLNKQKYCNLDRSKLQYCWNGTDGPPMISKKCV
jgi:hypothetical protein